MDNAENSFKIDVIRPVNLPFIQEEMTLCWISDKTARWTDSNAKIACRADNHDLRDTISENLTPRKLISYDGERKTSTCYDALSSHFKDVYESKNAIKLVFKVLSSKPTSSAISKLHFLSRRRV